MMILVEDQYQTGLPEGVETRIGRQSYTVRQQIIFFLGNRRPKGSAGLRACPDPWGRYVERRGRCVGGCFD